MSPFIAIVLSGIVATVVMTVLMYSVSWSTKMANGDMIRTLGSFTTKSLDNALSIGTVIHAIAGISFAFLYYKFFTIMSMDTALSRMVGGAVIGAAHGIVVSIILIIVVAEHHPIERFRKAGFPVALLYLIAHILYGFMLGFMFNTFNIPTPSETETKTELGYHIDGTVVPGEKIHLAIEE